MLGFGGELSAVVFLATDFAFVASEEMKISETTIPKSLLENDLFKIASLQ